MLSTRYNSPMTATRFDERGENSEGRRIRGGENGVFVKQPANLENGRDEEEAVDGEHVIWRCSRRTGNGSYDGVKPDKGNKEEGDTALTIVAWLRENSRSPGEWY